MGNEKVELGANWIHGVLGNPVYEFAMQQGLVDILQIPKSHKIVAATEAGKQVPFPILQEIYEAYLCFLKRCEEYFISQYLPPDGIDSVGDHIKLEINLYLEQFKDKNERHLRELIFDCLLKRETCISGCDDMKEIDLLELGSYTELQGGNIVLPGGYSSILEPLTRYIPSSSILKEHPVKTIYWNKNNTSNGNDSDDSDRTVIEESPDSCKKDSDGDASSHNVKVVCENGKHFYADHVICTVPLGVLKHKYDTLFEPKLPEHKIEAINNLLFGTVDKILLEYERPFLNPNITEVMLLWDTTDYSQDIKNIWFKKIYSFTKISDTLLLGWISGREAEYMEKLSNDVVVDKCTEILRKFLNDPFIPKPKNCVCTSWFSQPYTRGSYTSLAVGSSQVDIENLAQPLYSERNQAKPVVLFAGEHTHSNFYSTVHGAYLTGRTAAQLLLSPDAPEEIVMNCDETSDLSSWIQGISLA
ncbi:peroxisomal N(1)-acetyl-spermine/spermidine oxidase isoform X2 [Agrilus planipennis]|nr:peroxisomal N(1)-acetyl-spermine/spermidine oxidase isoform X2 [Agrilus planipennis]XP_018327309.1 peroxisomal N(1)-acetyl-spermine/spermidine oxidase isoform X2 [Agrilus planipennis]